MAPRRGDGAKGGRSTARKPRFDARRVTTRAKNARRLRNEVLGILKRKDSFTRVQNLRRRAGEEDMQEGIQYERARLRRAREMLRRGTAPDATRHLLGIQAYAMLKKGWYRGKKGRENLKSDLVNLAMISLLDHDHGSVRGVGLGTEVEWDRKTPGHVVRELEVLAKELNLPADRAQETSPMEYSFEPCYGGDTHELIVEALSQAELLPKYPGYARVHASLTGRGLWFAGMDRVLRGETVRPFILHYRDGHGDKRPIGKFESIWVPPAILYGREQRMGEARMRSAVLGKPTPPGSRDRGRLELRLGAMWRLGTAKDGSGWIQKLKRHLGYDRGFTVQKDIFGHYLNLLYHGGIAAEAYHRVEDGRRRGIKEHSLVDRELHAIWKDYNRRVEGILGARGKSGRNRLFMASEIITPEANRIINKVRDDPKRFLQLERASQDMTRRVGRVVETEASLSHDQGLLALGMIGGETRHREQMDRFRPGSTIFLNVPRGKMGSMGEGAQGREASNKK